MRHDGMRQAQLRIINSVRHNGGGDACPGFIEGLLQHLDRLRVKGRCIQQLACFHRLPSSGRPATGQSLAAVWVRTIQRCVNLMATLLKESRSPCPCAKSRQQTGPRRAQKKALPSERESVALAHAKLEANLAVVAPYDLRTRPTKNSKTSAPSSEATILPPMVSVCRPRLGASSPATPAPKMPITMLPMTPYP